MVHFSKADRNCYKFIIFVSTPPSVSKAIKEPAFKNDGTLGLHLLLYNPINQDSIFYKSWFEYDVILRSFQVFLAFEFQFCKTKFKLVLI